VFLQEAKVFKNLAPPLHLRKRQFRRIQEIKRFSLTGHPGQIAAHLARDGREHDGAVRARQDGVSLAYCPLHVLFKRLTAHGPGLPPIDIPKAKHGARELRVSLGLEIRTRLCGKIAITGGIDEHIGLNGKSSTLALEHNSLETVLRDDRRDRLRVIIDTCPILLHKLICQESQGIRLEGDGGRAVENDPRLSGRTQVSKPVKQLLAESLNDLEELPIPLLSEEAAEVADETCRAHPPQEAVSLD
jgi:hypothetical protein